MAKPKVETKTEDESNFVSQAEFDVFREQSAENTNTILDAIKSLSSKTEETSRAFSITEQAPKEKTQTQTHASPEKSNYTLAPAYQAIFEEYFDPSDGFEGRMEGATFSIIVPMKFCNADEAWKSLYRHDIRTKVLLFHNIEGGMRDWCKLVAQNLKYNRKIVLK